MIVKNLFCSGMKNPLGISLEYPVLSWQMESDVRGTVQTAYRLFVYENTEDAGKDQMTVFYDSERIESEDHSVQLPICLSKSSVRYDWRVQIWDNHGETSVSEEDAWFETGLLYESDWKARWAEPNQKPVIHEDAHNRPMVDTSNMSAEEAMLATAKVQRNDESVLHPSPMLRKVFSISSPVKRARIYATAHGVYHLELNGEKVGDYELAPEITPYQAYLQVQTYDVTNDLAEGDNCLGVILGDGWWAGRIGNDGYSCNYGDTLALLAQIHVTYADGTREIITMDNGVTSSQGPLRYSDNYMGERWDDHYARKGWSTAGFTDTRLWEPVQIKDYGCCNLTGQNSAHMKVVEIFDDVKVYRTPKGELIADAGRVISGALTAHLKGTPGASVKLTYTQELDADGNFWCEIMGTNSRHEDVFVIGESGEGDYNPVFSQTGFRYVGIDINFGEIEVTNAKAKMICSPLASTLKYETSDERLNKLSDNIRRTLLANAPSIPTDDADRERAGFGGDAQMACGTLCWYLDARSFYSRWLKEMEAEQYENGMFGIVTPEWRQYKDTIENFFKVSSAGWSCAGILIPWFVYTRYGDRSILEQCWPMMKKYVSFITERAKINPPDQGELTPESAQRQQYLWNADFNFGDWLTPSACYNPETDTYGYFSQTLTYLAGTYYYAYDTKIMAEAAKILGYKEEAAYFATLHERIREAAIEEIYKKGGIYESPYMGAHIMALHMGLCPKEERTKVFRRLVELIEEKGMDTGFVSTVVVCDILCEFGREDLAYQFLLNDQFPSWLYMVENGATSVWESMHAIRPNGQREPVSYALTTFCSIGNWMVKGVTGLNPADAGFKKISIRPYFTERLSFAEAVYDSAYGPIRNRWEKSDSVISMEVTIPANTTAEIFLPGACADVMENGIPVDTAEGIKEVKSQADGMLVYAGSGDYEFTYKINDNVQGLDKSIA